MMKSRDLFSSVAQARTFSQIIHEPTVPWHIHMYLLREMQDCNKLVWTFSIKIFIPVSSAENICYASFVFARYLG
jgi:hypothetical protein